MEDVADRTMNASCFHKDREEWSMWCPFCAAKMAVCYCNTSGSCLVHTGETCIGMKDFYSQMSGKMMPDRYKSLRLFAKREYLFKEFL